MIQLTESPVSMKILEYVSKNYAESVSLVCLMKACAIASSQLDCIDLPRLNIINVSPSRQLKSQTSNIAMRMFPKNYYYYTGSDFTIFQLIKQHKIRKLHKKCLCVNDMTLLMSSKAKRTKDRLILGLAELLSDGYYKYDERLASEELKGHVSMIGNMTTESYDRYEKFFSESSFAERFITIFHEVTSADMDRFRIRRLHGLPDVPLKIKIPSRIKFTWTVENQELLNEIGNIYSALALRTPSSFCDGLKAFCISHAVINGRDHVCNDDFLVITELKKHIEMIGNAPKIIALHKQGLKIREICKALNKNADTYSSFVSKTIKKAEARGIK